MKKTNSNNKGFTLVELIVVLVILAILAAILVPTLLGYIDRARSEKDYSTAQSIRVAVQAEIDELYGKGDDDVTWTEVSAKADAIFKLVGTDTAHKLDGQELKLVAGTISNNQLTGIIVSVGGKKYKYTSSSNTWEPTTAESL